MIKKLFLYIFLLVVFVGSASAVVIPPNVTINLTNTSLKILNLEFESIEIESDTVSFNDSGNWSNLTVFPDHQIDINISVWNDTNKRFTESSNISNTVTGHIITGMQSNRTMNIYRDGALYANNTTDLSGIFNWVYIGGYSSHEFSIVENDTLYIPPEEPEEPNTETQTNSIADTFNTAVGVIGICVLIFMISLVILAINGKIDMSVVVNASIGLMILVLVVCIGYGILSKLGDMF